MKILQKIMSICMIAIFMFSFMGIFYNETKAATYLINEANLYSKGEIVSFTYKGIGIGVEFVVYKKDGVEYPAYCLNRNLVGVTSQEGANVSVNKAIENAAVWRAIINGYPFKKPTELNCKSEMEAFAATKMAVYDALYTYNWDDFEPLNGPGKRIIEAAESISKKARSSNETKPVGKVEIEKITDGWKLDNIENTYISRTYQVNTNVESTKYIVKLDKMKAENVKITDENNQEKTEFASNEKFKILIPISELENKMEVLTDFEIHATANLKTKPILYGETADSNYQDYALTAGEWEFESSFIKDQYPSNQTNLKIMKQDAETGKVLEGAKFNILDENKNIVYSDVETNKEGIAEIKGIFPGKYYVQEEKSPDGYTSYEELIEIDIAFRQTYTVNVKNYEKPKEEEKEVEDEEITVIGEKEVALPRTGF